MKIATFGLLLFVAPWLQAQPGTLQSWLDAYLANLPPAQQFRGNILVRHHGQVILEKSYGYAIESWKVPNCQESRFEIASLTKQFTAAAILQLQEAGKLNVHDPVSRYYAPSPAAWHAITIEELLRHTSGIPNNDIADFRKGIAVPYTPAELIETFRDRPLAAEPGTKWSYTNTEYYLLAYIIEKVSGQSYGAYLADHIFRPLGMTHSEFASTLAVIPNMTEGYSRANGQLVHRDYFDRSLEIGAGGISTTVGDLLLWNNALDGPGFLSKESLNAMFTARPPGNYGFGWFVQEKPVRFVWHEGGDPGFAAFEARYPDEHTLIIVLSNEDDTPVRQTALALAKHLGIGE